MKRLASRTASEISTASRYFNACYELLPDSSGVESENIINQIECSKKAKVRNLHDLPPASADETHRLYLLNGVLNFHTDIEGLFRELKPALHRSDRVLVVAYSPYWRWAFGLATLLGFRKGKIPTTFLTRTDLENLCKLSGFEAVRTRNIGFLWLFSPVQVIWLRPVISETKVPSLTIVIPTRNEKGNIAPALGRLKDWNRCELEVIFVEGHSNDGTWEEIQRIIPIYQKHFSKPIRAFQQTGRGKNDAVRLGFSKATSDTVTILDADLTMPPELMHRFYDAYRNGLADFVNGSRLLYPMEGEAMRFLNHLGNIFFAKALSFVLGSRIGDSLCGTKLLARADYHRIMKWREDFGDFDPFGDFELLFPAAILGLGIIDVPIQYRARTYGTTNISRFQHGWMLLKMTWIGLFRIRWR